MQACRAMHEVKSSSGALKEAFTIFSQLLLASIAPYVLLTLPAALGFMAQLIAHAGHVQYSDRKSHTNGRLKSHLATDGVRLLGMPAAMVLLCRPVTVSSL